MLSAGEVAELWLCLRGLDCEPDGDSEGDSDSDGDSEDDSDRDSDGLESGGSDVGDPGCSSDAQELIADSTRPAATRRKVAGATLILRLVARRDSD